MNPFAQPIALSFFFAIFGAVLLVLVGWSSTRKGPGLQPVLSWGAGFASLMTAYAWALVDPRTANATGGLNYVRQCVLFSLSSITMILILTAIGQLLIDNDLDDPKLSRFLTFFRVMILVVTVNLTLRGFAAMPYAPEPNYATSPGILMAFALTFLFNGLILGLLLFALIWDTSLSLKVDRSAVCLAAFLTAYLRFFLTIDVFFSYPGIPTEPVFFGVALPVTVALLGSRATKRQLKSKPPGT